MTEQRFSYRTDRVLLEKDRLLTPQFSPMWLYLDGAQLEMLRNMTEYLNRPSTYVESYGDGYYITPDATDFDDIQAIVADLEDKLMGNQNTPFGYDDRLAEEKNKIGSLPGNNDLSPLTVPAGEMWCVTQMCLFNASSINSAQMVYLKCGSLVIYVDHLSNVPSGIPRILQGRWYLKEGDYVVFRFYGCTSGDNLFTSLHGYKMQVP